MGKGGTRFVSDAIATRAPRERSSFSARELKQDMDTFCETGEHPDIELAKQEHRDNPTEQPLPQFDPNRPFIYFDFSIARKPVGRVTVELFHRYNHHGVEDLRRRCKEGSRQSLKNTRKTELAALIRTASVRRSREAIHRPRLNHTDRGVVSVSVDGNEIAMTFKEDVLALDETHHVVGRVHLGLDVLDKINAVQPGPQDVPLDDIVITDCGDVMHQRSATQQGAAQEDTTSKEVIEQHRQISQQMQDELKLALEEGLLKKRKSQHALEQRRIKKPLLELSSSSSEDD